MASIRAPIARSGWAIRSTGRRRMDSSPSNVHAPPSWPASQPGSRRISVPALPTSMCASRAARNPGPRMVNVPGAPSSTSAPERAHGGQSRARVGRVEIAGDVHGIGRHRAEQRRAVRHRLVAGSAQRAPSNGPDGSTLRLEASRRTTSNPSSRTRRSACSATTRPRIHSATVPCEPDEGYSPMSTMSIVARPRARAISATIPGRFGTSTRSSWTSPPARPVSSSRRRSSRAPSFHSVIPAASPPRAARARAPRRATRSSIAATSASALAA